MKIRKNPEKTAKNRENPEIQKNPHKKSIIFDRFSLTHSGGSFVSLGTIINSFQ